MFRRTAAGKRKKAPAFLKRHDESDEDDDDDEAIPKMIPPKKPTNNDKKKKKKKTKKSKHHPILGSSAYEEEDNTAETFQTKKLGFGGGMEETNDIEEINPKMTTTSHYDASALQRLRQEQAYTTASSSRTQPDLPQTLKPPANNNDDDDSKDSYIIPLDTREPTILSGDAAHQFNDADDTEDPVTRLVQEPPQRPDRSTVVPDMVAEDPLQRKAPVNESRRRRTVSELRQSLQQTLHHWQDQHTDLETRFRQRTSDLQNNSTTLSRYETERNESQTFLAYYRTLWNSLGDWVGALRELKPKVASVLAAQHELQAQVAGSRLYGAFEMDVYRYIRYSRVLGRQPPSRQPDDHQDALDEFGRNVQNRHTRAREERRRKRLEIGKERDNGRYPQLFDAGAFVGEKDTETFRERHEALMLAWDVATSEIDAEYVQLSNLVDLFVQWKTKFPDDYLQAYATLSLADLATVLVHSEICRVFDPWSVEQVKMDWISVIQKARSEEALNDDSVRRLLEICVFPVLADQLEKDSVCLVSTHRVQVFRGFCSQLETLVPLSDAVWNKARSGLLKFVQRVLSSISVAIDATCDDSSTEEARDALRDATWGQLYRMEKILSNVLRLLAPIMYHNQEFVETILQFVSNEFLCLVSSLQHAERDQTLYSQTHADVFRNIHQLLMTTGWLENAEYILQAAPIRAAATVYSPSSKLD